MLSKNDKPPLDSLDDLLHEEPSKTDQQVSILEKKLEYERDARLEERFIFLLVTILLFDIMIFTVLPNIGGPIAIMILELLVLFSLAKKMGMEKIAEILDRTLDRMSGGTGNGED